MNENPSEAPKKRANTPTTEAEALEWLKEVLGDRRRRLSTLYHIQDEHGLDMVFSPYDVQWEII